MPWKFFNASGSQLTATDNVTVAALADGTDGELITWDTAGAPATVAVGTINHVLTSGGTGVAPTFQAAAAAGIASVVADTTPQLGGNLDMQARLLVGNGGSTGIAISVNGEVTMAAQPAMFFRRGAAASNVTGAGTLYVMVFTAEVFNQGDAWDDISTFTAPITGRYHVDVYVDLGGITAAADSTILELVMSNRTLAVNHQFTNNLAPRYPAMVSMLVDMDVDDELQVKLTVSGESGDVVDINSNTCLGIYMAA
jgi:hypothetical protein